MINQKIIAFFSLFFLLNNCSKNEVANFKCININGKERSYILSINLKDQMMLRAGIEYSIIDEDEELIVGFNENVEYENKIIFNRHTGDLNFSSFKKDNYYAPVDTASYKCEKSEKLI